MINTDLKEIVKAPETWPEIFNYRESIDPLKEQLSKYSSIKNIVLIGNGGSITSYDAYFRALGSKKDSYTVWTMEPDYLKDVKDHCSKEDTVVVVVSKSGNTLGLIESLSYFADFNVVAVTNPEKGSLALIAKQMGWHIIEHPPIGGRFSGGTSSAFVPAIIADLNVSKIQMGLESGYRMKDTAYSLAKYYFDLEKQGYNEVYLPIYSSRLQNFQNLIIQLMHESVCKDDQGQTVYCSLAPEAQHHTNQRFLGGKKNVIGTFIIVDKPQNDLKVDLPIEIKGVNYKDVKLDIIDQLPYQEGLYAEYIGSKKDADRNAVPNVTLTLDKITSESVGELVAFWQLVAYYSAVLRGVEPFDQPAVEGSKNITLDIIKER